MTSDQSSVPPLATTTSQIPPPTSGPNGPTLPQDVAAATTGGTADSCSFSNGPPFKDRESREGRGGDAEDNEVAALKKALRAAEERARACEKLLSESEERRDTEALRATRLEERVAELEKVLSEQSGKGIV